MSERNRKKGKDMTVEEAGHMGGQKVKRLIEEGKEHEEIVKPSSPRLQ